MFVVKSFVVVVKMVTNRLRPFFHVGDDMCDGGGGGWRMGVGVGGERGMERGGGRKEVVKPMENMPGSCRMLVSEAQHWRACLMGVGERDGGQEGRRWPN